MTSANIVSVALAIILCVGMVMGYQRGFIRQILELVGLVAALLLGLLFAGLAATYLADNLGFPYTPALIIGFVGIFIVSLLLFRFFALAMQKIIRWTLLGWVDRLTGALLGLMIGMIVASMLIWIILAMPMPAAVRAGIERSQMSVFLQPVAPRIFNLVFDHGSNKFNFDKIFKKNKTA
jgi:uncharacterized membrane protein required for colicin V production